MTNRRESGSIANTIVRTSISLILAGLTTVAHAEETPAPAIPWQRTVDVKVVTGFPETLGACGEWHPWAALELQLCLGGTRDILTSAQAAKWSWNTVMERAFETGAGETSFHGMGLGVRELRSCPVGVGCGFVVGPELFYAYEHVWWESRTQGWELSVEVGASYGFTSTRNTGRVEVAIDPLFRFGFGRAF